jgi:hypothetical protein
MQMRLAASVVSPGIVRGGISVPEIHVLQRLLNVHFLYERYRSLQIVTLLGRHMEFDALNRYLYPQLRASYSLGNLTPQVGIDPLPDVYGLSDAVPRCTLRQFEVQRSLVNTPACEVLAKQFVQLAHLHGIVRGHGEGVVGTIDIALRPSQIESLLDFSSDSVYRIVYFHEVCLGDHVKGRH